MAKTGDDAPDDTSKPIVDVAHPNKSAPAANSKSVIVPTRPMVKDPMVNEAAAKDDVTDDSQPIKAPSHLDLKPLSAPILESEEKPEEPKEPTPKAEAPEEKPAEETVEKPAEPEVPEEEPEESAKDPKKTNPAQKETEEVAEQAKRNSEAQKLIDSKKYFVPINAVEKRKSKRFVVLGILLSILLGLVWVDIALDAALIQINNVTPLTHFFSN